MNTQLVGMPIGRPTAEQARAVTEVAFISGLWSTSAFPQWGMATRVAERPAHVIHLPGHNGDEHNLRDLCFADCFDHVLRELQKFATPPHVIGHSFGGLLAKAARQIRPDLMKSVVAICATPPGQIKVPLQTRFAKYLIKLWRRKVYSLSESDQAFVKGQVSELKLGPESGSLSWELLWKRPELYKVKGPPVIDFFAEDDQFLPLSVQSHASHLTGTSQKIIWGADHMWHCNPNHIEGMRKVFDWIKDHD